MKEKEHEVEVEGDAQTDERIKKKQGKNFIPLKVSATIQSWVSYFQNHVFLLQLLYIDICQKGGN